MTSTEKMEMKMEHRLTRIPSGVRHNAVPGPRQAFLFRDVGTGQQEVSQEIGILIAAVLHSRHMLLRNDQRMDGRLRVDIVEGQRAIILIHDLCRDRLLDNFAK